jgi:PKD repeat protein
MARRRRPVVFVLVLVALLLLVAVPVGPASAAPINPASSDAGPPHVLGAARTGSAAPSAGSAPMVGCLSIPRGAPCYGALDASVVDLISNSSGSGSRFSVDISLPPAGTAPVSALTNFWVGLWVSGAPCAVDGASYLQVELFPPDSPSVSPTTPNWSVRAPVEDLVPTGSCDPLCQNASAVTSLGGVPLCEDNIVLGGGSPPSAGTGQFAPGDQLQITAWGTVAGPTPLAVWANDTSNPSESVAWSYNANDTSTGLPVFPRYDVSNGSDGGWSTPTDVAFGWTGCPSTSGLSFCNSYDGPAVAAVGLPTVTRTEFWNTSSSAMTSYPWIATASSTGGCAGAPSLPGCSDFGTFGGTGTYPGLQIVRTGGGAAWRIGGSSNEMFDYGGAGAEYAPTGVGTTLVPSETVVDSTNGSAGVATVNVTVADPRGVEAVRAETYWCTGVGPAVVQTVQPAPSPGATLANVSVVLNVSSENGPLTFWLSERSNGSSWTPGVGSNLTMTGGTGSCVVPAPAAPVFGASNVTAVAGGFRLDWTESSAGILGFTVTASPVGGGSATTLHVGDVGTSTILGLSSSLHYNLTVTARSLSGSSTTSYYLPPGASLAPFTFTATAVGGPLWHARGATGITLAMTGGATPYAVTATLGNGTTILSNTSSNLTALAVELAATVGVVTVTVSLSDANGVMFSVAPLLWDVWAGPLAPAATANAGDGALGLTWPPSISPAGPVLRYAVYLAGSASSAASAYRVGATNTSANSPYGAVEIWNSTGDTAAIPWPDNTTAYAIVVPYDAFGPGFATSPPLAVTPAPLSIGPISGGPGGPAPFTTEFSTLVTTGTNDSIDEAIYSFPGFAFLPANLTQDGPGAVWMNVSATISQLGLAVVLLHVSDVFGSTAIGTTSVWVSPGAAPSVAASASPEPAYVGVPVEFQATATGTGPFVFAWSFGDGANATGSTANHSYASAGTFTATVTVTDNGTGARSSSVVPEKVFALPRVAIVASAGPNGSESFAFHAALIGGSGNGTFAWAFGDGSTGKGENVTHDYSSPGDVIVNVTATDASLRTAFANISLSVPSTGGGGAGSSNSFPPIAQIAVVAAVAGWLVAGVLFVRERAEARRAAEDDEDEFDEP